MMIINGTMSKESNLGAWYDFTKVVEVGDVCYIPFVIDGETFSIKLDASVYRKMRGMSFWKWLSTFNPNVGVCDNRVYNACLYNRYGVLGDNNTIEFDCHFTPSVYDSLYIRIELERVGDVIEYELMVTFNTVE